jgi:hypothetical protein
MPPVSGRHEAMVGQERPLGNSEVGYVGFAREAAIANDVQSPPRNLIDRGSYLGADPCPWCGREWAWILQKRSL